jgi:hypothetical protein
MMTAWKVPIGGAVSLEAALTLAVAEMAIRVLPFRHLAPRLGRWTSESGLESEPGATRIVEGVRRSLAEVVPRVPWHPQCLAQAIAAKVMLGRRGVRSTLYLGLRCRDTSVEAHAWVRAGATMVTGGQSMTEFVPIGWWS